MNKKICILAVLIINLSVTTVAFASNSNDTAKIIGGLINIFAKQTPQKAAPPAASKATINTEDSNIFISAVETGDYELVQQMLDRKVNINGVYNDTTALYTAYKHQNRDMMQFLIEHGANVNGFYNSKQSHISYVVAAAYGHDLDTITYLIGWGADINGITNCAFGNDNPLTAVLKDTTQSYSYELVAYLINSGVNVNQIGEFYGTPLTSICRGYVSDRSKQVFFALLNAGADINKRDKDGYTPLYLANQNRNMFFVKELLARGAK